MGVTIKDVANAAGVSVATVSYALNGTGRVSPETLRRVQAAAEELGYVPNGIAKALQAKGYGMVGYFAYTLTGPFFGQIMAGIEDTFVHCDEELIASSCASDRKKTTRFLRERILDGAIIFVEHLEDEMIQRIANADCPVVVMDRELSGQYISSITVDNRNCAYEVGRYLHSLGFHTVGCVIGRGPDGIQRNEGFRAAVKDFGLELREDWVLQGDFAYNLAYQQMLVFLESKPVLPEVFFAFNDEMAMGIMDALKEKGYRIPEDISVIGMDDIAQASFTSPKLTTYHLPIYERGVQAAKLLLGMLNDSTPGSKLVLPGYIVERDSCQKRKSEMATP